MSSKKSSGRLARTRFEVDQQESWNSAKLAFFVFMFVSLAVLMLCSCRSESSPKEADARAKTIEQASSLPIEVADADMMPSQLWKLIECRDIRSCTYKLVDDKHRNVCYRHTYGGQNSLSCVPQ